jgi:hypothetical protein
MALSHFGEAKKHFFVMADDGVFTDPVEGGHMVFPNIEYRIPI